MLGDGQRDAPPRREPRRLPWLVPAVGMALAVTLLAPGDVAEPEPETMAAPALAAERPIEHPHTLEPGYAVAGSVAAFESFVEKVNRGDSAAALALLMPVLPPFEGLGVSQWPFLPTDAGLWVGGIIDQDKVEGFVRYVFNVPGSVFVSDCEAWEHGPLVVVTTCAYETNGGALLALGQRPEQGQIRALMIDHRVVGIARTGQVDLELWRGVVEWAAEVRPERVDSVATRTSGGWALDPVYTAATAWIHGALAEELATSAKSGPTRPGQEPTAPRSADRHHRPAPAFRMIIPYAA